MHVVHVTRRFAPMRGGIERYVLDLARGQVAVGHNVTVLTLDRDIIGDLPGRLARRDSIDGVEVVRLPGFGNRRFAVCTRPDALVRELLRGDVIHHHDLRFMTGLVATTAMAGRRPLFVHTHGLLFHTPWASTLKRQAVRLYFGPLLRLAATRIIASSEPDRSLLLRHAPYLNDRTVTFENATVLDALLAVDRHAEDGLIVAPGRLAQRKGLDDLLHAVADVKVPWRLEISGTEDHEERRRLERMVDALHLRDHVAFMGPYSDSGHLAQLGRAALCIFPSRHEGVGLALLEAMAAGVPLLARDIPAHRSVLGPDLEDRLVEIDGSRELSRAIERALSLDQPEARALSARL